MHAGAAGIDNVYVISQYLGMCSFNWSQEFIGAQRKVISQYLGMCSFNQQLIDRATVLEKGYFPVSRDVFF